MAFSFGPPAGTTPAAPAPAGGGFSFGGSSTTPAQTSYSGFSSSANPAGANDAAPAAGGLFGSTPAAAAPAVGGLFGTSPSAAPTSGGLFGTFAPVVSAPGIFGSIAASAPSGGGMLFGAPALAGAPTAIPVLFGTPYSQLPNNAKKTIDGIYELMINHRRTMASAKTMAPSLLLVEGANVDTHLTPGCDNTVIGGPSPSSPADAAAGVGRRSALSLLNFSSAPLPQQIAALETQIQTLTRYAEMNMNEAQRLKIRSERAAQQAQMHGAWPVEAVAARRGVALSTLGGSVVGKLKKSVSTGAGAGVAASGKDPAIYGATLQYMLNLRAASVDRLEEMPSQYLWDSLHGFEERVDVVQKDIDGIMSRLQIAEEAERVRATGSVDGGSSILTVAENFNYMTSLLVFEGKLDGSLPLSNRLATLARSQNDLFLKIASETARAHDGLDEVKLRYRHFCESIHEGYYEDPFLKADVEEVRQERDLQQRIMARRIASDTASGSGTVPPGATDASAPAPSASTGSALFGATPAPAPGGMFRSTPAPAPSGLFGSTPAPSPGGFFGSAVAPVAGGLFGAPAPTPSTGGLFGSSPPATASGGLFGSTPAPSGFGGTVPAPALPGTPAAAPPTGGLFAAPTTPASTLAPRKKSGGRGGRRR